MNRHGFSLVEALVAAVLVGSACALLYGSVAQVARGQQLKAQQAVARRLLANHLALLEEVPAGLVQSGEEEEKSSQGRFTWSLTTRPGPVQSLAEATLTIRWPMSGGEHASKASVSATTYRRVPAPPS